MKYEILPALLLLSATHLTAQPPFRTDDGKNETAPWFQLVDGEFPPEGSAHHIAGELIESHPHARTAALRADRTDAQTRDQWDHPVPFEMLPYGTVHLHGAPAALRHIPLGTHLHGAFYRHHPDSPPANPRPRHQHSEEAEFTRCLRLEDDFSYHTRLGQAWQIRTIDTERQTLTLQLQSTATGEKIGKPATFDLLPSTRLWKGNGYAQPADLAIDQLIQINTTWATLFGPGRLTDIWIDQASRTQATDIQTQIHRTHIRDRGLPCRIETVDNQEKTLTVTLFTQPDPTLLAPFTEGARVTLLVAEPSLRTYDQVNDREHGKILTRREIPAQPGSSGIQLTIQADLLLEGFRPHRILRLLPPGWPLKPLPREEALYPERD